ncbi:hypothetical protein P5F54_15260, partial [Clostridium perfringens]|nr:hypothetical protein [Clostridium perfringens]
QIVHSRSSFNPNQPTSFHSTLYNEDQLALSSITMQYKALALLAALVAVGSTQDIDNNDVPNVCRSVCQTTVDLTTQCDRQNDDDDSGFISCVCSTSNANSFIPE